MLRDNHSVKFKFRVNNQKKYKMEEPIYMLDDDSWLCIIENLRVKDIRSLFSTCRRLWALDSDYVWGKRLRQIVGRDLFDRIKLKRTDYKAMSTYVEKTIYSKETHGASTSVLSSMFDTDFPLDQYKERCSEEIQGLLEDRATVLIRCVPGWLPPYQWLSYQE